MSNAEFIPEPADRPDSILSASGGANIFVTNEGSIATAVTA